MPGSLCAPLFMLTSTTNVLRIKNQCALYKGICHPRGSVSGKISEITGISNLKVVEFRNFRFGKKNFTDDAGHIGYTVNFGAGFNTGVVKAKADLWTGKAGCSINDVRTTATVEIDVTVYVEVAAHITYNATGSCIILGVESVTFPEFEIELVDFDLENPRVKVPVLGYISIGSLASQIEDVVKNELGDEALVGQLKDTLIPKAEDALNEIITKEMQLPCINLNISDIMALFGGRRDRRANVIEAPRPTAKTGVPDSNAGSFTDFANNFSATDGSTIDREFLDAGKRARREIDCAGTLEDVADSIGKHLDVANLSAALNIIPSKLPSASISAANKELGLDAGCLFGFCELTGEANLKVTELAGLDHFRVDTDSVVHAAADDCDGYFHLNITSHISAKDIRVAAEASLSDLACSNLGLPSAHANANILGTGSATAVVDIVVFASMSNIGQSDCIQLPTSGGITISITELSLNLTVTGNASVNFPDPVGSHEISLDKTFQAPTEDLVHSLDGSIETYIGAALNQGAALNDIIAFLVGDTEVGRYYLSQNCSANPRATRTTTTGTTTTVTGTTTTTTVSSTTITGTSTTTTATTSTTTTTRSCKDNLLCGVALQETECGVDSVKDLCPHLCKQDWCTTATTSTATSTTSVSTTTTTKTTDTSTPTSTQTTSPSYSPTTTATSTETTTTTPSSTVTTSPSTTPTTSTSATTSATTTQTTSRTTTPTTSHTSTPTSSQTSTVTTTETSSKTSSPTTTATSTPTTTEVIDCSSCPLGHFTSTPCHGSWVDNAYVGPADKKCSACFPCSKLGPFYEDGGGCAGTADSNCVRCPADTQSSIPCVDCRDMHSYEAVSPSNGKARQCRLLTVCNASEYEVSDPTHTWSDGMDRVCAPVRTCAVGEEYEVSNATAYTNRICKAYTTCPKGDYVVHRGTATSDRACAACPAGSGQHEVNAVACGPTTPTTSPTTSATTSSSTTSSSGTSTTLTGTTSSSTTSLTTVTATTTTTTTTTTAFVGFTCQEDRALPGNADISFKNGDLFTVGLSREECQSCCNPNALCASYVFRSDNGYCEMWSTSLDPNGDRAGRWKGSLHCTREGSLSTSTVSTTTRTSTTATTVTATTATTTTLSQTSTTTTHTTRTTRTASTTTGTLTSTTGTSKTTTTATTTTTSTATTTTVSETSTTTATATTTTTSTATTVRVCTFGEFYNADGNDCRGCHWGTFNGRESHSVRSCQAWETCLNDQFESASPTASSDRICSSANRCNFDVQYESKPTKPGITDRQCSSLTVCQPGEFAKERPTETADRRCMPCRLAHMEWQDEENQPACKTLRTCGLDEHVDFVGSATRDITCKKCTDGFEQLQREHRLQNCDRVPTTSTISSTTTTFTTSTTATATSKTSTTVTGTKTKTATSITATSTTTKTATTWTTKTGTTTTTTATAAADSTTTTASAAAAAVVTTMPSLFVTTAAPITRPNAVTTKNTPVTLTADIHQNTFSASAEQSAGTGKQNNATFITVLAVGVAAVLGGIAVFVGKSCRRNSTAASAKQSSTRVAIVVNGAYEVPPSALSKQSAHAPAAEAEAGYLVVQGTTAMTSM